MVTRAEVNEFVVDCLRTPCCITRCIVFCSLASRAQRINGRFVFEFHTYELLNCILYILCKALKQNIQKRELN